MVGDVHPTVQPVIVPKIHCSREGLLYFNSTFIISPYSKTQRCSSEINDSGNNRYVYNERDTFI